MSTPAFDRRRFLIHSATGAGALSAGLLAGCDEKAAVAPPDTPSAPLPEPEAAGPLPPYRGPNVILVRFGGGVRRRETILYEGTRHDPALQTYCPFIYHELAGKRGVLLSNVEIQSAPGIETSHGQGTLYILTGRFDHYEDITHKPLSDRFEPKIPTLFEYFRRQYDVPEHQCLIINGEDRINEEFYTFSNHHQYGVRYRSTVLSLYRFKTYLLREALKNPGLADAERLAREKQLAEMESKDYRVRDRSVTGPELDAFWAHWRAHYGDSGLVNPRGDRLLTALALRALQELRPRLMMINYQDTDYVHWGNPNFYTRAVSIIDDGVREIYSATQADDAYRDNTVFVVIPDCGRDNNRCMAVPYQHHFNSSSAHQIFLVAAGPGIAHARAVVEKSHVQTSVVATLGRLMKFPTRHAEGPVLGEVLA